MMCAANGCYNEKKFNPKGVSFHRFPSDKVLRAIWINNLNLDEANISEHSIVCSEHFRDDYILKLPKSTVLQNNAIPELKLSPTQHEIVLVPLHQTPAQPDAAPPAEINEHLKDIILNVKAPHIIRNMQIPWPCFRKTLAEWTAQFDNYSHISCEDIEFDVGTRTSGNSPQWERYRQKKRMTMSEFYEKSTNQTDLFGSNWAAFGYKNIEEMPKECADGFDFSFFGFAHVLNDITFWISSTDAHTPCHYDTYGCNIVVQVYGSKSWLLFPPEAKLTPTRIPYEESSVYCTENFFSPPDASSFTDISETGFQCTLNPGDVLIVPPKWWHYVETVSPSLSVNAWIPIKSDIESQIEECIVRILIKNFIEKDKQNDRKILNPNEMDLTSDNSDLYQILNFLVNQQDDVHQSGRKHEHGYLSEADLTALLDKFHEQIVPVSKLSKYDFTNLISCKAKRYDPNAICESLSCSQIIKSNLINSVCNPTMVSSIKNDFISRIKRNVNQ